MTKNACTPEIATAKMAAMFEAGGITADVKEMVTHWGEDGERVFHEGLQKNSWELLRAANPEHFKEVDELLDNAIEPMTEKSKRSGMGVYTHGLKPTDLMPKELTDPVLNYIDEFAVKNAGNFAGKHGEFVRGFKSVLKGIDSSKYGAEVEGEFAHWARKISGGYPFYGESSVIKRVLSNTGANHLAFSGNILMGNPFEALIKLPTVYGVKDSALAVREALTLTKGNIWAKIPELEARGFYGYKEPIRKDARAVIDLYRRLEDSYMMISDRPLKNIAFAAGRVQGGSDKTGLEAIEKIAFMNRLGNDSRLSRDALGGSALRMTNYTLGTYHLLGGYVWKLVRPASTAAERFDAARALGTYGLITGLVGGPAAVIPEPVGAVFGAYSPEYKKWEKENLNPVGKLIRAGSMGSLFITAQMMNRAYSRSQESFKDAAEKLGEGDVVGAAMDLGDAGLNVFTFLPSNPLGNPRVQGVLRDTRKLFEGDEDIEEFKQKTLERFFPVFKKPED